MATIADGMIADGVTVLAIVNLDSDSGASIQQKAASPGRQDHRLRPSHSRRVRRRLRVVRQHQSR